MPEFDPATAAHVDYFGPSAVFHHVGLAVADIEAACPGLEHYFDPVQDVAVAFANAHGITIEFISPGSRNSPVFRSLARNVKLVHLCYSVSNLKSALSHADQRGFRTVADPVPAVAFGGRKIAWVYHPILGLFELLEAGG
jgi:methylmalonyl-CoA/ethylmalonyl-CoA epimerase